MSSTVKRLLTFFIGVPLVLAFVYFDIYNHLPLNILIFAFSVLGSFEFCNIVKNRYFEVASDLGLNINLEEEFKIIESFFSSKIDEEYLVSRGEFLAAKLMANYLGFTFIDAANLIFFDYDGKINEAFLNIGESVISLLPVIY